MPWPAAAGCPAPARQPLDQGRARHGASPACQPSSGPLLSPEGLRGLCCAPPACLQHGCSSPAACPGRAGSAMLVCRTRGSTPPALTDTALSLLVPTTLLSAVSAGTRESTRYTRMSATRRAARAPVPRSQAAGRTSRSVLLSLCLGGRNLGPLAYPRLGREGVWNSTWGPSSLPGAAPEAAGFGGVGARTKVLQD